MAESVTRERWRTIQPLLDGALELEPALRAAWLAERCGGDAELQAAVERLAAAFADAQRVLPSGAPDAVGALARLAEAEAAPEGTRIGPYRIVGEAGRGGMGVVYLAERADDQYRKRVALKLLHRGMDDPHLVRRFLEERQILATLDHPHIAKLLDGGVTAERLPWFAMEYVEGAPIDVHCDRQRLTVDDRLRLFLAVCDAVQYAHYNLVVHRDLKPSNILVTADEQVKLLDFGIAKLLARADASEPTLTQVGRRALTPEYASPEQVRGQPVTVASDVYSLGVVLYALLCGRRPYEIPGRLERDIEQAVLEAPVTAPSLAATRGVEAAAARGMSPERLRRRLRGDLDVIVLTALRKEPERRYPSVEALGADLRRHLDGRPVLAQPDRWRYRAAKFLRRHAVGVSVAAGLGLLLAGFGGLTAVQSARIVRERDRAEQVSAFVADLLQSSDPYGNRGPSLTVREVLDGALTRIEGELSRQPKVEADLLSVVGRSYNGLGLFPQARSAFESAIALRTRAKGEGRGLAEDEMYLADVLDRDLDIAASDSLARAAVRTARSAVPPDDPFLAKVLTHTAAHIGNAGRETEADSLVLEAIEIHRRHGAAEAVDLSQALGMLADRRYFAQDWVAAETLWAESLRLAREHEGPNHPDVGQITWALGLALGEQDKPGGERLAREGLAILQHSLGPDHPDLLPSIWGLAHLLLKQGDVVPAESLYRDLTIRGARINPSGVRQTVWGFDGLAQIALRRGDTVHAEVLLDSALAVAPRVIPPTVRWSYAPVLLERGQLRAVRRDYPGAEAMLLEALDALHRQWGDRDARTRQSLRALVGLYAAWGKPERARFYQDRLGPPRGAAPRASSDSARGKGESRPS